jgi:hypothetical protein
MKMELSSIVVCATIGCPHYNNCGCSRLFMYYTWYDWVECQESSREKGGCYGAEFIQIDKYERRHKYGLPKQELESREKQRW